MKSIILISQVVIWIALIGCNNKTLNNDTWSSGNVMPTGRSEMTSTIVDGKIYVIGGIRFRGSTDKVEAYDIESNTWEKLPNLPKKLNHIGIASDGQKIYVSGGFLNMRQTKFVNTLYAYDIGLRTWTSLRSMPGPRASHYMIYKDGQLHLLGGKNHEEVWTYTIASDSWSTDIINPLPERRDHISVLQDDNNLFVVGGRQSGIVKADCWQYDFLTKKWTVFTQIPTSRGGQTAALIDSNIHIIGGEDLHASKTYGEHNVYNLIDETWHLQAALPTPRHGLTSEIYHRNWYIIGGGRKAGIKTLISVSDQVEIFKF